MQGYLSAMAVLSKVSMLLFTACFMQIPFREHVLVQGIQVDPLFAPCKSVIDASAIQPYPCKLTSFMSPGYQGWAAVYQLKLHAAREEPPLTNSHLLPAGGLLHPAQWAHVQRAGGQVPAYKKPVPAGRRHPGRIEL